jgi:hypothetical protein
MFEECVEEVACETLNYVLERKACGASAVEGSLNK